MEELSIAKFRQVILLKDSRVVTYLWNLHEAKTSLSYIKSLKSCIEEFRSESLNE